MWRRQYTDYEHQLLRRRKDLNPARNLLRSITFQLVKLRQRSLQRHWEEEMNKEDEYIFRENEFLVIIHSKFRKWVFVGCE